MRPALTSASLRRLPTCSKVLRIFLGGERGPVTFPVFKAGDSVLRGSNGGFDSHTLPPSSKDSTDYLFDLFGLPAKKDYATLGNADAAH